MENNESQTLERLNLAIDSHKFYNQQCVELEKKINIKIETIFQTEETGKNISKKDIVETTKMITQLLTSSNKYMMEGQRVVSELEKATEDDIPAEFAKSMKNQLVALNSKQQHIHNRVEEIQEMLNEMYGLDEDDTF
mgnify:CR=1 FL=1|tara:strand:+ start:2888 stop:3298 length:411 start_codon:yes stop_codon:yes gene_type:complete